MCSYCPQSATSGPRDNRLEFQQSCRSPAHHLTTVADRHTRSDAFCLSVGAMRKWVPLLRSTWREAPASAQGLSNTSTLVLTDNDHPGQFGPNCVGGTGRPN